MTLNEEQVYRYYRLRLRYFGRDQRTYDWGITARALGSAADEQNEWCRANGYRTAAQVRRGWEESRAFRRARASDRRYLAVAV